MLFVVVLSPMVVFAHRYLQQPLDEIQTQLKSEKTTIILLLDALDEAADGYRNWAPVASLIAKE